MFARDGLLVLVGMLLAALAVGTLLTFV